MKDYLTASLKKLLTESREQYLHNKILVYVKDPLPENVNLDAALTAIEARVPAFLFSEIDSVYVGQFPEFKKRNVNALYKDGAIYLTNDQKDESDMVDDIVHETAHSIEQRFPEDIYGDKKISSEFLHKRRWLLRKLSALGFNFPFKHSKFYGLEYSKAFDDFLYLDVGYEYLRGVTSEVFISPYAITSLREYFANGFEYYFLNDKRLLLKKLCPELYEKIEELDLMARES